MKLSIRDRQKNAEKPEHLALKPLVGCVCREGAFSFKFTLMNFKLLEYINWFCTRITYIGQAILLCSKIRCRARYRPHVPKGNYLAGDVGSHPTCKGNGTYNQ